MSLQTTIATFRFPHDAYIFRTKLESEGIKVFMQDELTIQTDNFLSIPMGGVKVQVSDSDIEQAQLIMKEFGIPAYDEKKRLKLLNPFSKSSIITAIVGIGIIILFFLILWATDSFHMIFE